MQHRKQIFSKKNQKQRSLCILAPFIVIFIAFVPVNCATTSPTNCPDRLAFCPENSSLNPQTDFCQISYNRDVEFLSQCGPVKPGPICSTNSCNGQTSKINTTPFDPQKACFAMQLIQAGIGESPSGTWNASAQTDLRMMLNNNTATVGVTAYGGVRYFQLNDQNTQWIVFLGSKTLANWLDDLHFGFVYAPQLGMQLHNGFLQTAQSVYSILKTSIIQNPGKKIRLTGHSLGGGVATILALMLAADNYNVDTLITFGQPQITDASGALTFIEDFSSKVPLIRFINHNDRVPFLLASLKNGYTQFGPEVRLETDQTTTPPRPIFAVLAEPDNTRTLASGGQSGTADHQPSAYNDSLNQLFCPVNN